MHTCIPHASYPTPHASMSPDRGRLSASGIIRLRPAPTHRALVPEVQHASQEQGHHDEPQRGAVLQQLRHRPAALHSYARSVSSSSRSLYHHHIIILSSPYHQPFTILYDYPFTTMPCHHTKSQMLSHYHQHAITLSSTCYIPSFLRGLLEDL